MVFNSNDFLKHMESEFNFEYMPKMTINNLLDAVVSYGETHFKDDDLKAYLIHTIGEAFDIDNKDLDPFFEKTQKRFFNEYCKGREQSIDKISMYFYDSSGQNHDDAIKYSIALKQKLRTDDGWKDCYVLYQDDEENDCDFDGTIYMPVSEWATGEYYDINLPYVYENPMMQPDTLALQMDFDMINKPFKDQMIKYWIDSKYDEYFSNPIYQFKGDLLTFYDKWRDNDGNDYVAAADTNNQLWVGCESSDGDPDKNLMLCYSHLDTSVPSYDIVESQYAKHLKKKQKGKTIE